MHKSPQYLNKKKGKEKRERTLVVGGICRVSGGGGMADGKQKKRGGRRFIGMEGGGLG